MSPSVSPCDSKPEKDKKMNCNETLFDAIASIEAYPFDGTSSIRTMGPQAKHVKESALSLDVSGMIPVPVKKKTCKLSEKEKAETAGDSFEVSVTWQIQSADSDVYEVLDELKVRPKHLILRTYNNGGYFIRCEEYAYRFSYIEKDGLLECEMTFHNSAGVQRIL